MGFSISFEMVTGSGDMGNARTIKAEGSDLLTFFGNVAVGVAEDIFYNGVEGSVLEGVLEEPIKAVSDEMGGLVGELLGAEVGGRVAEALGERAGLLVDEEGIGSNAGGKTKDKVSATISEGISSLLMNPGAALEEIRENGIEDKLEPVIDKLGNDVGDAVSESLSEGLGVLNLFVDSEAEGENAGKDVKAELNEKVGFIGGIWNTLKTVIGL